MPLTEPGGGAALPEGGQDGDVLKLADASAGVAAWGAPGATVFRGDWQADSLVRQYDFATNGLIDFTTNVVGPDSAAAIVRPTNDIAHLAGESEPTGTVTDAIFTHAAKLKTRTKNGTAEDGSRFAQISELSLDLAALGIPNISRIESWIASKANYSAHSRNYITVSGNERVGQSSDRPWTKFSLSVNSSDVVTWGVKSDNNLYDSIAVMGVTGVRIYATEAPYMLGEFVTYQGKMWKSALDFNAATPGVDSAWAPALELPRESGSTAERPDPVVAGVGFPYFDTTLGRPIWSSGAAWVDATGTAV